MAKGKPGPDRPVAGYFRISQARDEMIASDLYEKQIRDYRRTNDDSQGLFRG